jgi:hypothetical protein
MTGASKRARCATKSAGLSPWWRNGHPSEHGFSRAQRPKGQPECGEKPIRQRLLRWMRIPKTTTAARYPVRQGNGIERRM